MQTVFVAGATGYLGRYLCAEYKHRGWTVVALVRNASTVQGLDADRVIEAEATRPETLGGVMANADVAVSALGLTRQADGLGYWDVDYQANINLLEEARRAGVTQFGYVHVLNADQMADVPLVAAKNAFVRKLQVDPIRSTIIAPSGFFSDMGDLLTMARKGRLWVFGAGAPRINPIHGADLASVIFDTVAAGTPWRNVGGPEVFSQIDLARLCFEALHRPARITHLPDICRRAAIWMLPRIAPRRVAGPAQFFLTALGMDMIGDPHGARRLADHFRQIK